jgi:hypothetical protein
LRTSQGYIFSNFTTFRDQILEFYYFERFFPGIYGFLSALDLPRSKLVYNANWPLILSQLPIHQ